ncbi:hypothetical protein PPERSA_00559 [Pseudocohnilembus persalinus]|uniref:E3 ubiquitin-protein ligase listerin n=1 Tax=Pseudocohnilembus persalinus TaxID=266149 RepID=A0A0V0QTE6_PSEPJ|nr:hypothetical protein PPERSA_00559 [Pseudocohnilembus persalinus]|eukprot:KRX05258.1 hypothetical protein PPERSA_00559 [Pseudocohnilembus persalinus]
MEEKKIKQKKGADKSAKNYKTEANLFLNQFNTNTNIFSQLSAQYLQSGQEQGIVLDANQREFIKKTLAKKDVSFNQYEPELQKILSSLNKKSEVTKLKALDQLNQYLQKQEAEFFQEFIITWSYMYKQFVTSEIDRRLLEEANRILLIIIQKNKKCIQSKYVDIFPYWFMCANDVYNQEIARIALRSFNECFPQEKQYAALNLGFQALLKTTKYYLNMNAKTIAQENINLSENQAQEICDRLTFQSLYSVKQIIQHLRNNFAENDNQEEIYSSQIFQELFELVFQELDKNGKLIFIAHLEEKKRIRTKAATIEAFNAVFDLVNSEQLKNIKEETQYQFAKIFVNLIDDKDRIVQIALWNGALVNIFKKIPKNIIQKCDQKAIEVKTLEIVKKCGNGIGQKFYQSLIFFLSFLPQASILPKRDLDQQEQTSKIEDLKESKIQEKLNFLTKFFETFSSSAKEIDDVKFFADDIVKAYFECLYFVIIKRLYPVYRLEKFQGLRKYMANFIKNQGLALQNLYVQVHDQAKQSTNVFQTLPQQFAMFLNNLNCKNFNIEENNEEEIKLVQKQLGPFMQEIEIDFEKNAVQKQNNSHLFSNYLSIFKSVLQKLNKNNISFPLISENFQLIHSKMIENIQFEQNITPESLASKIDSIQKYSKFTTILNQTSQSEIVQNILIGGKLKAVFQTIKENLIVLIKNFQNFGNQIQIYEQIAQNLIQILYNWREKKEEISAAFSELVKFLKEVYSNIDINLPQYVQLLIIGFHLIQPQLPQDYFYQYLSIKKGEKHQQENLITKTLTLQKRQYKQVQENYSQFFQEQEDLQNFIQFLVVQSFEKIKIYSKLFLPCQIMCLISFSDEKNVESIFQPLVKIQNGLKSEILDKKSKNFYNLDVIENIATVYNVYEQNNLKKESHFIQQYSEIFDNILDIINHLYQNKLVSKAKSLLYVFTQHLKKDEKDNKIQQFFENSLKKIVENHMINFFTKNQEKQVQSYENFNAFQQFIMDLLKYLQNFNFKKQIYLIVEQVFQKKYFKSVEFELKCWKIIQIIINQTCQSIDLQQYFTEKLVDSENYFWLFSIFLSTNSCIAIMETIQIRKYFIDFSNQSIKPILQEGVDKSGKNREQLMKLINYMLNKAVDQSLVYAYGLKLYVKDIFAEEQLNQQILQQIFDEILIPFIEKLLQESEKGSEKKYRQAIVLNNILSLYMKSDILKEESLSTVQNNLTQNFQKAKEANQISRCLVILDILSSFSQQKYILENSESIANYLFEITSTIFSEKNKVSDVPENYQVSVFFDCINYIIETNTIDSLIPQLSVLEKIFRQTLEFNAKYQPYSSQALQKTLQFLRKVIPLMELFSDDFKYFAINSILDTCVLKFKQEDDLQNDKNQEKMLENQKDEAFDLLIIEFAETISRFALILDQNFDENLVYELMNCSYPAIQKACFILLDHFYKNFVPSLKPIEFLPQEDPNYETNILEQIRNPDLNIDNLVNYLDCNAVLIPSQKAQMEQIDQQQFDNDLENDENEEQETQEPSIVQPETYSFLLTWISFINKINSPLIDENNDKLKKVLTVYLDENKELYTNFLTILFNSIDQLDYNEQQLKEIIKPEEISRLSVEWSDFLNQQSLFILLIQSLYIFCTKFPSYLRIWIDETQDKKFAKLSENLIKTFISTAIFANEVETIELSQSQWQSEEFNIYVQRNTREISAVYTKESQKLEIYLQVPPEYPIKPIVTDIKRGVKIDQMKLQKWMLMMKSLLLNQNGNIKDILVRWKDNLDKVFEGIEECPICYYVIHSSTGELPKLSCKTCKYKFHSTCIHKWFNSSNKSDCPMCKSQFM